MKTINITVGQLVSRIVLGRRGETEATQVVFDISYLISLYGSGTVVLMAKRPPDTAAYPVTVEQDDSTVTWTVTDTDTSYKGRGECELFYYVGDTLAKSVVYTTVIGKDIGTTTEEPPDAYETWIDTLTALGATTRQNAQDAAASADDAADSATAAAASAAEITGLTVEATTLAAGSSATASYANGTLTLGIPKGDTGSDAVTYILEPSVGAVVYDPNAAVGARLSPSSVTVTLYKVVSGVRNDAICSCYSIDATGSQSFYHDETEYTRGSHSHMFSLQTTTDETYKLTFYAKSSRSGNTLASVSIPVVARGLNGERGPRGDKGDTGATGPAGVGVPSGGTAGQVLAKASATDYDTEWVDQSAGGGGSSDYDDLTDKPQINGVTLSGNKTAAQFGLAEVSDIPTVPVQSVNGQTGAVVLSASDVGALPDSTSIPTKTSDLTNDSGFVTDAGVTSFNGSRGAVTYTAPVTSVNGSTGAVTVSVPTKTSDLTNDSGFITSAPVASVNGQTGAVVLDADDVGAIAAPASPTSGQFLVYNGSAWVAQTLATWQGGSY